MKKLTLFVIALFCANVLSAQITAGTKLYLRLDGNTWSDAWSVRYAAFFFGESETWVNMDEITGGFEVAVPEGDWTTVIFVRLMTAPRDGLTPSPVNNYNNWDNRLHQTVNLPFSSIGNNNIFTVTSWGAWRTNSGTRAEGNWSRRFYPGTTLYLQPNIWNTANPRYTAHFLGRGENQTWAWPNMEATGGEGGFFQVAVPNGLWHEVIFLRMNPENSQNVWNNVISNNVWAETPRLTFDGTNNLWIITATTLFYQEGHFAQYGLNLGSFTASTWSGRFENLIPTTFFLNGVDETQKINVLVVDVTEDETSFNIFQSDVALLASQSLYSQVVIPSGSIIRAAAHWHPIEEAKDNTHTVVLPYGIVSINGEEINEHENFEFNVVVPRTGTVTISGEPVTHNTQSFGDALPAPESLRLNIENIPVPENITTPTMKVTFNLVTNEVIFEPVSTGPGTNVNTPNESSNVVFTVGRTIRVEMEQENNRVMLFNSLGQMIHSADAGSTFEFTTASAGVYFVRVNESNYKVIVR